MKTVLLSLFPPRADNTIRGGRFPVFLFGLIAIVSTARSLIHIFAPDGGAGSIAGIDLSVAGADGIVFAFGLWGSAQLVYALVQLAAAFRYRSLVPAMYFLLFVETVLRMLVGRLKPITFTHTPPGAVGNYVLLPLSIVMLAWSLWPKAQWNRFL